MAREHSATSQQELVGLRQDILSDRLKNVAADGLAAVGIPPGDLRRLRILIVGPIGHGKSAFVNTVERAVFERDEQVAATQGVSKEGTFYVDEYFSESAPFSLLDTRGTTRDFSVDEVEELQAIMNGTLRSGECLLRSATDHKFIDDIQRMEGEETPSTGSWKSELEETDVGIEEQVHAVVFVFIRHWLMLSREKRRGGRPGMVYRNIVELRKFMTRKGYRPLVLLTFMDEEDPQPTTESMEGVQELLGCGPDDIFCITNYTKHGQEAMPDTDKVAMQLIQEAMQRSGEFICRQALLKKESWCYSIQEDAFSQKLASGEVDVPVQLLLAILQERCGWPTEEVSDVITMLKDCNVTSARLLRDYWLQPPMQEASVPFVFRRPIELLLGIQTRL